MMTDKNGKNRILLITAALIAVFVFGCTFYRALTTNLTDDEAYTILFYVRNYNPFSISRLKEIFMTCKANNHWLNTFLIYVSTSLCGDLYNEAAIRMPALLFFGAYLAAAITALYRKRISFPAFVFLTCNYYLNEFMGLARGYGLAAVFLFFTLLFYIDWRQGAGKEKDRALIILLLMLTLAAFSNTVVLLAYPSVGLPVLYCYAKKRQLIPLILRHVPAFLMFVIATGFLVVYHLGVSDRDTGLYVGTESFLKSTVMEYAGMLVTNRLFMAAVVAAAGITMAAGTAVLLLKLIKGDKIDRPYADLFIMLLIFTAVSLLSGVVFRKGYITGRTTLPFWSLVVLGYYGLIRGVILPAGDNADSRWAIPGSRRWIGYAGFLLAGLVFILFIKKVDLTKTRDWTWDYGTREKVEKNVEETGVYSDDLIQDYTDVFYMSREGLDISRFMNNED